jgi:tRNA threonylcarbamoyladenosine modification (KEOPS) complex Cgi121 subunit
VGDRYTTVIGISDLDVRDAGELIDDLRNTSKGVVSIQGVCADAVYGIDHILQALKITIESERRKITLVGRLEMDLLLRISCTDQITVALRDIGLRNHAPGCFILFSKRKKELLKVTRHICDMHLQVDDVVKPSNRKKELICRRLGIQLNKFLSNDVDFTSFLSERAALLTT